MVAASTQASVSLKPTTLEDSRLAEWGDRYRLFRFTKIIVEFCKAYGSVATSIVDDPVVVGYTPAAVGSPPTTFRDIMEMDHVAMKAVGQTTKCRLVLGRQALKGVADWYVTESAASNEYLDRQGTLWFSLGDTSNNTTALAGVLAVKVIWVCQFKGRLPAGLSLRRQVSRLGLSFLDELEEEVFGDGDSAGSPERKDPPPGESVRKVVPRALGRTQRG